MSTACIILLTISSPKIVKAQQEVSVDQFTGTANVTIPLYTIGVKDIAVPISLSYSATGVKVNDQGGEVGSNWVLAGVPVISREVKGLPDEVGSSSNSPRKGWLQPISTTRTNAVPTPMASTTNTGCTTDEEDIAYYAINALRPFASGSYTMYDSEPDVFSYSLPGHSGKFVFDSQGNARTTPYDPIVITKTINPQGGMFSGISIKTPNGATYAFNDTDVTKRSSITDSGDPPTFFTRDFDYYDAGSTGITYSTTWHITDIYNVIGEAIHFSYRAEPDNNANIFRQTAQYFGYDVQNSTGYSRPKKQYSWTLQNTSKHLISIESQSTKILFNLVAAEKVSSIQQGEDLYLSNVSIQSSLNPVDNIIKNYSFSYITTRAMPRDVLSGYWFDFVGETIDDWQWNIRYRRFLRGITINERCTSVPGYHFSYQGLTATSVPNLPPTGCAEQDYWGYSNANSTDIYGLPKLYKYSGPSSAPQINPGAPYRLFPMTTPPVGTNITVIPGMDRLPIVEQTDFEAYALQGTLIGIQLPSGGKIDLKYQPHRFFDPIANEEFIGGGARISEIHLFDKINGAKQIRKYSYSLPNGHSSGRTLSMPCFAFVVPSLNPTVTSTIVRSNYDLNTDAFEKRAIGYSLVTEKVDGHGSTVSTYSVAAASDDIALTPAESSALGNVDWHRSFSAIAKKKPDVPPSNCPDRISPFETGYDTYPLAQNTNFDFRRGSLLSVAHFAEPQGNVVKPVQRTEYMYRLQQNVLGRPNSVEGVAYDLLPVLGANSETYAYAKYSLLTEFIYNVSTQTETVYDQTDPAKSLTTTTHYGHNANGYLATVIKRNGSGNYLRTRYKYISDYSYPANTSFGGILQVQANRQKTDLISADVVETISEVITPAGMRSVAAVSFNTFKQEGAKTRPYQTWSWQAVPALPILAYADDSVKVEAQGSLLELRKSSRFQLVSTIEEVDANQTPLSMEVRAGHMRSGLHMGYNGQLPVLSIKGALASEAVFSNFESDRPIDQLHSFQANNATRSAGAARTGEYGLELSSSVSLQATLPSTPATTYATLPQTLRLSFWARTSTTAAINLSLNNASLNPISIAGGNVWQQYEQLIDVRSMPRDRSGYTLSIASAPSSSIQIDDVLLLPTTASAQSSTYNPVVGKSSETDGRGKTTTFDYNRAGQLSLVRDHNGAIISSSEQVINGYSMDVLRPTFTISGTLRGGSTIELIGQNVCAHNATYEWDFGDGTSANFSSASINPSISHVYPLLPYFKTYNVRLRVTLPAGQGAKIISQPITIASEIMQISACTMYGVMERSTCPGNPAEVFMNCGINNAPTNATMYTAVVIGLYANSPNLKYTWYKTGNFGPNFIQYGQPTSSPVIIIGSGTNDASKYMCIIELGQSNDVNYQKIVTAPLGVKFNSPSQGYCPATPKNIKIIK